MAGLSQLPVAPVQVAVCVWAGAKHGTAATISTAANQPRIGAGRRAESRRGEREVSRMGMTVPVSLGPQTEQTCATPLRRSGELVVKRRDCTGRFVGLQEIKPAFACFGSEWLHQWIEPR